MNPRDYRTWTSLADHPVFSEHRHVVSDWSPDPTVYDDLERFPRQFDPDWYVQFEPKLPTESQAAHAARDVHNLASCNTAFEREFGWIDHELFILGSSVSGCRHRGISPLCTALIAATQPRFDQGPAHAVCFFIFRQIRHFAIPEPELQALHTQGDLRRRVRLIVSLFVLCPLMSSWTSVGPPHAMPQVSVRSLRFDKIHGPASNGAVLDVGPKGAFDQYCLTCPSVVFDGTIYCMWYSSLYDPRMGCGGIGLATSPDGLHWTRASDGEPVLRVAAAGAFDNGQLIAPDVHYDGHTYRMWYTGSSLEISPFDVCCYRVGLATSEDGVHWQRANHGRPVLELGSPGSHDDVQVATPSVLREGDGYRMWYAAWGKGPGHTICVARSSDGIHWERENERTPVTGLIPTRAYGPKVCRIGNTYLMLFAASLDKFTLSYGATSADGIHWEMLDDSQPVIPPGAASDFDQTTTYHPALLVTDDRIRVWYTGTVDGGELPPGSDPWTAWQGKSVLRIGLAEARFRQSSGQHANHDQHHKNQ